MEILGVFRDVEGAARAGEELVRAGFTEAQLDSLSSVPYPDGVLVKTKQHTRFRWVALAGGLAGAAGGFALAAGTAWLYPVQTGDKPIIALYPTAIITFEVTMLFALMGTMAGMFLEMRLPPLKRRLYDPAIADGCIGISVTIHQGGETVACEEVVQADECIGSMASLSPQQQRLQAEEIMKKAGALRTIME